MSLIAMLEKWKRSVDNGKAFGALLTDLSTAFDCLDYEPLIAKLNTYGFSLPALRLIHDYLSHRNQRTRVNNSYSKWLAVMFGAPQGSILRPLLFNLFLSDLFLIHSHILILQTLQIIIRNILSANADKCHFLVSTSQEVSLNVNNFKIKKQRLRKTFRRQM